MRKVLGNVGWLLGGRGVNAVLSLAYLALATRALGLQGFGEFALVVALGQAATGISTFQTWQLVVRWGARAETADDALGFAIALDLIGLAAGAVLALVFVYLGSSLLPLTADTRATALAYCLVTLLAIRSTPIGILRLHDRFRWSATADSVTPVVRCLGAGAAALWWPTVTGFLAGWAAAELATSVAYWTAARRCRRIPLRTISWRRLPARDPGVWRFALSTNLTASVSTGLKQVLLLVVGAAGGAQVAALYRVAGQLGHALLKLAQALLQAVYPELIRDPSAAYALAVRLSRLAAAAALCAVLLATLTGPWLIDVVAGHRFAGAYGPMVLLALAGGVELSAAGLEALLVAQGRAARVLLLRAVPAIACLLALPYAVGHFHAVGAAAAVLAGSATTAAGIAWAARPSNPAPSPRRSSPVSGSGSVSRCP